MDKTLNNRYNMSILCSDINNQRTLKPEKICRKHRSFMHEQAIELIFFEE
jgi:hypothetical protein